MGEVRSAIQIYSNGDNFDKDPSRRKQMWGHKLQTVTGELWIMKCEDHEERRQVLLRQIDRVIFTFSLETRVRLCTQSH